MHAATISNIILYLSSMLAPLARETCQCARLNAVSGPFLGEGGRILALCVYNMPAVSTISKPRPLGADRVFRLHTAMPIMSGTFFGNTYGHTYIQTYMHTYNHTTIHEHIYLSGTRQMCQLRAFFRVPVIVDSFVPTGCPVHRGMWHIFGKPLKMAIWNILGLHAELSICLRNLVRFGQCMICLLPRFVTVLCHAYLQNLQCVVASPNAPRKPLVRKRARSESEEWVKVSRKWLPRDHPVLQGQVDQATECGPYNRWIVGNAFEHKLGASKASKSRRIGRI